MCEPFQDHHRFCRHPSFLRIEPKHEEIYDYTPSVKWTETKPTYELGLDLNSADLL